MDPIQAPSYFEEPYSPPPDRIWHDKVEYTRYAFYAALVGGVLILIAAFIAALFLTAMATFGGGVGSFPWALDTGEGDRNDGFPEVPITIGLWGLVTGGAVILAALRAKERPDHAALAGVVMVAAGVLSFFALGGFILGGLLAIVAGVLAVAGSRSVFASRPGRLRDRAYARP